MVLMVSRTMTCRLDQKRNENPFSGLEWSGGGLCEALSSKYGTRTTVKANYDLDFPAKALFFSSVPPSLGSDQVAIDEGGHLAVAGAEEGVPPRSQGQNTAVTVLYASAVTVLHECDCLICTWRGQRFRGCGSGRRCPALEQTGNNFKRVRGLLPQSQGQNLAVTVSYVPRLSCMWL